MERNKNLNKKADLQSIFYVIITLFSVGILFFFMSKIMGGIYGGLDTYFEGNADYNNSIAHTSLQEVQVYENFMWDYAFFGLAIGFLIMLGIFAYSTQISPVFYFIYGIVALFGIVLSVIFSNTWQAMAAVPEMADTIARFPITNLILGTYYPTFIVMAIILTMILLFGKSAASAEGR